MTWSPWREVAVRGAAACAAVALIVAIASVVTAVRPVRVAAAPALALPSLPQAVQRQGLNVSKSRSGFLQIVGFVSTDGSMTRTDIADYVIARAALPLTRRLRQRPTCRTPCNGSGCSGFRR